MKRDLTFNNIHYLGALINENYLRMKNAYGDAKPEDHNRISANIKEIEAHYAAIVLGPCNDLPISKEEAAEMCEYAEDIDADDIEACRVQANGYYGHPEYRVMTGFTGRYVDIRDRFSSYIDQTSNERRIDGLAAEDFEERAYGRD